LNTAGVLLRALQLCLAAGENQTNVGPGQSSLTETLLALLERRLVAAAGMLKSVETYQGFATATVQEITSLLDHAVHMRPGTDLHHRLMRVLPFLTYTNQSNMGLLINHFDAVLNFTKFDEGHSVEDEARLEAWVALCDGIERNELGNTMKNEIVSLGIVSRCTDYIKENAPPGKKKIFSFKNFLNYSVKDFYYIFFQFVMSFS
jgi:E3 ubiquitin-protein ligase UBR4